MPEIAAAAEKLQVADAILDGEVVALNQKGIASFADLQAAFQDEKDRDLTYFAFDLLHLNGRNLRGLSLLDRKTILAKLFENLGENSVLRLSEHLQARGTEMFTEACRLGAEGIVSKLASASYSSGRGTTWLKVKCIQEQELVIGGFTPQSKGQSGIGALLLGYYEMDKLQYAGRSGTGFSQQAQRLLRERLDPLVRKRPAFSDPPRGILRDVRWVEPKLVAQIAFSNWTRDGLVRQAAFKGLREDKPAEEVIREVAIASTAVSSNQVAKHEGKTSRDKRSLDGGLMASPAITHPEKVLDETTGMTKHELAAYYMAVSDDMLHYITNRPLSIVRCPGGSSKPCFFQKHVGSGVPQSVRTVPIPNRKGGASENYLTVDSAEGLVGLAQMGVLEIHSWGSHNDSLDKPDMIVIDLDPDTSIEWKTLAESAQQLRKRLQDIGLESLLKCTGGKGLHIVVPIRAEHEWSAVKQFSHAVVRQMEEERPDLYVTKMTKAIRKNRIFLDYLRNDREATSIAPFSPRARLGAPVALPLDWAELKSDAMPIFRVADFAKWKKRLQRDRWAALWTSNQRLSTDVLRAAGVSV
jgi:bifunctional non-homologous end joining protein LigD